MNLRFFVGSVLPGRVIFMFWGWGLRCGWNPLRQRLVTALKDFQPDLILGPMAVGYETPWVPKTMLLNGVLIIHVTLGYPSAQIKHHKTTCSIFS